jgi:hypothetical protein
MNRTESETAAVSGQNTGLHGVWVMRLNHSLLCTHSLSNPVFVGSLLPHARMRCFSCMLLPHARMRCFSCMLLPHARMRCFSCMLMPSPSSASSTGS